MPCWIKEQASSAFSDTTCYLVPFLRSDFPVKNISICLICTPMHFFNCCHLSVAISVVQGFLGWFFVCVYSFVGEEAFLEFDSRLRDVNLVHIFNDVFKPCSSLPFFLIFFFFPSPAACFFGSWKHNITSILSLVMCVLVWIVLGFCTVVNKFRDVD